MAADPVFNVKADFAKRRGIKGVQFVQRGVVFDAAKNFVERIPGYRAPRVKAESVATPAKPKIRGTPPPAKTEATPEAGDSNVLASAKKKLGAFAQEIPEEVKRARRENAAAAAAEENAE